MIKLICAIDQGNAIGWTDGRLAVPGLKADMARFKELTSGHTVVMGFNTWKSLRRPTGLPNRKNIVLTRKPYREAREYFSASADIDIISDLDYVKQQATRYPDRLFWIIGGASVYQEALEAGIVDEIYLTIVHTNTGADVVLPVDLAAWKLFVLREREKGVCWEPMVLGPQWDGEFQTTYLHLTKQR